VTPELVKWVAFWSLVGIAGLLTLDAIIGSLGGWVNTVLGRQQLDYKIWLPCLAVTAAVDVAVVLVARVM